MPSTFEWAISILLPFQLTWLSSYLLQNDEGSSSISSSNDHATSPSYALLFVLYLFLDASYTQLFHTLLLIPARYLAYHLPGAVVPPWSNEKEWLAQEEEMNDVSIIWPMKEDLMKLSDGGWIVNCKEVDESNTIESNRPKRKSTTDSDKPLATNQTRNSKPSQPYYLNHVRGSTRIRQASQRIGAALGTLFSSFLLCSFTSHVTLEDIGLDTHSRSVLCDLFWGIVVGALTVTLIFVLELSFGWIRIVGYFYTVETKERFLINFSWDILFHIGVAINEEIMLRGWMYICCARGIQKTTTATQWVEEENRETLAMVMAVLLQSTFFSLMHYHSPGSTSVSLLNLFIGGIAASFNFLMTNGTLWLGIGWHFGWNIMMGHVLGRSTSGIPMSCAVFHVIPRPASNGKSYEKLHGGVFGPEQGVLAPLAYLLGMCIVNCMYGMDGFRSFRIGA